MLHGSEGKDYLVRASFLEIYNEDIRDLLAGISGGERGRSTRATRSFALEIIYFLFYFIFVVVVEA